MPGRVSEATRPTPRGTFFTISAGRRVALSLAVATLVAGTPALADDHGEEPSWNQGRVKVEAGAVLPERHRVEPINAMTRHRLETLLPRLMRETGIEMWLVLNREYAEDPVYFSLVPTPSFAARRTTMLVFHDRGDDPETGEPRFDRLTVNRYPLGDPYESAWEGGDLDSQWEALGALIGERDPKTIGINVSRDWPIADGLTHGLHQRLIEVLPEGFEDRLQPAQDLVIRWFETRTEPELAVWPRIVGIARGVIAEAFSSRVITPGVTTTDDIAWYLRQRFADLDLRIWFMPYVNAQRPGLACTEDNPFCGETGVVQPGDVLHTDVGICYLTLCTDTQEMGYIVRLGEEGVPAGLQHALEVGNRWQDHLTGAYANGRPGNEILAKALEAAEAEGILSSVYTHPLGFVGHAPGPTIGMWDDQDGTPIRGDWPLYPNTGYAIEGNVKVAVPEWDGQLVQIKLEQDAVWTGEAVHYLAGRQTEWLVVD